jgi:hypothetical protein
MLQVNQLTGFGIRRAGGAIPTLAYQTATNSGANSTSYTFSTQAIGTAAADRLVVVVIGREPGDTLSSSTIGGISATVVANAGTCTIIAAVVTTGTTADVVLNFAGTQIRIGVAVYAVYGLSSTTATSTYTASLSETVTIPAGGVAIGCAYSGSGGVSTTWTGVTENSSQNIEAGGAEFTTASIQSIPGFTGTVSIVFGTGGSNMAVAVWR